MSSQINFYMMPDDVAELDDYLKKNGWAIIQHRSESEKATILPDLSGLDSLSAFLVLSNQIHLLKFSYSATQKCWFVDELESEVIQYRKTIYIPAEHISRAGRLYYTKIKSAADNSGLTDKDPEFLKKASALFNWFKKHFKNTKINSDFTTLRATEFMLNKLNVNV